MNYPKLEQIFILVRQGAKQFKIDRPNGDGRAFWQPLKHLFGQHDIRASSWRKIDAKIVASLLDLSETDEFGAIIEINHFLRQQVRIPTQEEPTLRRIM